MNQQDKVARFRNLHDKGNILVLPNAWDAASARMVQEAGAKAIATSSAALAWSNGHADGQGMTREVALAAVRRILRVVTVPVSVDSEAGYSDDAAQVVAHVKALAELGVAGINLEDGRGAPDLLAAKIAAIKASGVAMFVNARCDVYLSNLVGEGKREELVRRGRLYRDAGADGLFAPAVTDPADIAAIVAATPLPVNILVMRAAPPVAKLRELGVRRISTGALMGRAAYGKTAVAAKMLLGEGRYDAIFETSTDCPDFNALFG
jgi:2-methylisocitrate lyase-like PEP mutase family enzyme